MNKLITCLITISMLTVTACQSTPDPIVVVEPFFPAPPRVLMEKPAELSTIAEERAN
jgi:hypothetical protein